MDRIDDQGSFWAAIIAVLAVGCTIGALTEQVHLFSTLLLDAKATARLKRYPGGRVFFSEWGSRRLASGPRRKATAEKAFKERY
jgi:hypothetical protein